jgi:hypothetical protein
MHKVAGQLRAAASANNQAEDFIHVVQTINKRFVGAMQKLWLVD